MKALWKLLVRAVFLLVVLALLGVGCVLAWFKSQRLDKQVELESHAAIITTTAGPVEFAQAGDGPPVLVFHAAPGGYDQGLALGAPLRESGFRVISFSRPGYLRTPQASGVSPSQQADLAAALLDALGVQRVGVLGAGFGAPAAFLFAAKYPDRVNGVALLSPATKSLPPISEKTLPFSEALNAALTGDMGSWMAVVQSSRDSRAVLETAYTLSSSNPSGRDAWVKSVLASPAQNHQFRDLVSSIDPIEIRGAGMRNDLVQLRQLPDLQLDKIAAPVLIIAGKDDARLSIPEVQDAVHRLQRGSLYLSGGTGHLSWLGPDAEAVRDRLASFFKECATAQP